VTFLRGSLMTRVDAAGSTTRHARPQGRSPRWPYLLGAVLSIGFFAPFMFRQNAWFEWGFPYWLLVVQHDTVRSSGLPSFFIQSRFTDLYYPNQVFYGGYGLAVLAYLSVVVTPWIAFLGSMVAAAFGAFVGLYWTTKGLGVSPPLAAALASAGVAAPYYLTDVYGRGAWAEFVAVSMVSLLLGSAVRYLVALGEGSTDRVALVLIAVSVSFILGMHNITSVLGLSFLALVVLLFAWVLGIRWRDARRLVPMVVAFVIGAGLTAAWLVPDVWLAHRTMIAGGSLATAVTALDRPSVVLWPILRWPEAQTRVVGVREQLYNQTESLFLIPIGLLAIATTQAMISRRRNGPSKGKPVAWAAAILVCLGGLLFALMTHTAWWTADAPWFMRAVPTVVRGSIQFPYRLNSYLTLALLLVVTLLLVGATYRSPARRMGIAFVYVVAAWYVGLGVYQVLAATPVALPGAPGATRASSITADSLPPTMKMPNAPQLGQFRLTQGGRTLAHPPDRLDFALDGRAPSHADIEPNHLYSTNIVWSPLVAVSGARVAGETGDGLLVLQTLPGTTNASEVRTHSSYPLRVWIGIGVSIASVMLASFVLCWWLVAWRRTRARPDLGAEAEVDTGWPPHDPPAVAAPSAGGRGYTFRGSGHRAGGR